MQKKIRVGIVGCGGMARSVHIPSYQKLPDVEVVACADINEKAAIEVSKKFGIPHYYTDYHKMFKEIELDAVSICTPNVFHKDPAIEAMKNGASMLRVHDVKEHAQAIEVQKKLNHYSFNHKE